MQNSLEHPKDVEKSLLSEVIEASAPLKYFLTKAQLQSLLKRAEAKQRELPVELEKAIKKQITLLSNMPELDESLQQVPKVRDTEMMANHLLLTQEEAPS